MSVRIQDDLYTYVNQQKLDELVIPDDQPCTGGFNTLALEVEQTMIKEFNDMCNSNTYPDEHLKRACSLFKLSKDVEKKAKDGIAPALKVLNKIKNLASFNDFSKNYKDFKLSHLALPLSISVSTDMKNTKKHIVSIQGPSVILPDASYYKPEMAPQKEMIMGIWVNATKAILAKTDLTEEEQNKYLEDTLAFDALVAGLVKTSEEWSEYVKSYNPMNTKDANKVLETIDLELILNDLFGFIPEIVSIAEPRYLEGFKTVFNENTFEQYKHWAYVVCLLEACPLLTEELRDLGSVYMRTISGIPANTPVEKFSYQLASGLYSEPVGLYYGKKYFGEEAKKDITEIVYQIIDTYKKRIKDNEILGEATKEKAILKLSKLGVKMGYPDKASDIYNELIFDEESSLFEAVYKLHTIKLIDSLSKLDKPTDPTEWAMPGHMVNACFNPFVNDITFPAAILQAPFYSINQTRSENLGGIGAVIGHEISHAFDSNGAMCDEFGNINNWWTEDDMQRFSAKIEEMVAQFDGIELPWGKVNGRFIVSENMADNGGVAVTLDIMSTMKEKSYEEYFANWAKIWCMKAKPEYLQLLINLDVHGPNILRANMPPRNFNEWYEAFDVKETDQMYIEPSKRVVIW